MHNSMLSVLAPSLAQKADGSTSAETNNESANTNVTKTDMGMQHPWKAGEKRNGMSTVGVEAQSMQSRAIWQLSAITRAFWHDASESERHILIATLNMLDPQDMVPSYREIPRPHFLLTLTRLKAGVTESTQYFVGVIRPSGVVRMKPAVFPLGKFWKGMELLDAEVDVVACCGCYGIKWKIGLAECVFADEAGNPSESKEVTKKRKMKRKKRARG